jgi:peptidoglycan/LPS O-acetylase OafA/YrhL
MIIGANKCWSLQREQGISQAERRGRAIALTSTSDGSYRPEIDGLRAVAVVLVMLFHARLRLHGGYVGVDVFFVISGYLITTLIWRDLDADRFSLARFWERRARRIIPALVTVVIVTLVAGWFLLLPQDYRDLGRSVAAQSLLASNIFFWSESGYFAAPAEVKPLLHFWSLAVEEQFYVLLPFLAILLKQWKMSWRFSIFSILGMASFALSAYSVQHYRPAAFYLLPSRGWELLLGCGLASIPTKQAVHRAISELLSACGLFAILVAAVMYDRETHFPGIAALLPCAGATLFIWSNGQRPTLSGRLLAWRPIVFIGLLSYSLYLWHWPVLVYAQYWAVGVFSRAEKCGLLALCFPLAFVSWWLIETPVRKHRVLPRKSSLFGVSALALFALLIAGIAIDRRDGLPARFSQEIIAYANGRLDTGNRKNCAVDRDGRGRFDEIGTPGSPVKCLVWGDSEAQATVAALETLCEEYRGRCVVATHAGTFPLLNCVSNDIYSLGEKSVTFNQSVVDFVKKHHVKNVMLAAMWQQFPYWTVLEEGTDELAVQRQFRRRLLETVTALQKADAKVWILQQVPEQRGDVPKALARAVIFGSNPRSVGVSLSEHRKKCGMEITVIQEMVSRGVVVLDPSNIFSDASGFCCAERNGRALYADHHHLSDYGARQLVPLFRPIFGDRDRL